MNEHIIIGTRELWGQEVPFSLLHHDRRHHLYTIGKSGSGKTTLLRNLILQDIEAGRGVAVIDPHGDLANDLLDHLPRHRIEDVAYFNPSDLEYASGLFQSQPDYLKHHYAIPDVVTAPEDPLNAKALSEACLKGTDPDTYRGLATRSGPEELGRMLEVFLVLATTATQKRITKKLANAAIQSYEAKKATHAAAKVLGKI